LLYVCALPENGSLADALSMLLLLLLLLLPG
jgi:hypothetical protein